MVAGLQSEIREYEGRGEECSKPVRCRGRSRERGLPTRRQGQIDEGLARGGEEDFKLSRLSSKGPGHEPGEVIPAAIEHDTQHVCSRHLEPARSLADGFRTRPFRLHDEDDAVDPPRHE